MRPSARHPDVTDLATWNRMAEQAMKRSGRIDTLINNTALCASLHGGRFNLIVQDDQDRRPVG